MNGHLVLIGDSIFDNAAYVAGGPAVIDHVRRLLPQGWQATLVAVDGATVSSTFEQLARIPADATHLVLSAGGNDALVTAGQLFFTRTVDVRGALEELGEVRDRFARDYRRLVDRLSSRNLPLTICTVYDSVPGLGAAETAGLSVFNDVITRTAFAVGAALIDLRILCEERADYADVSPIEPSVQGGRKIARTILEAVLNGGESSRVFASHRFER